MTLLVRERPPLRLSAQVTTPWGQVRRLGDSGMGRDALAGLTFSSVMPGGFEQATVTLNRDPRRVWADIPLLSTVQIRGAGGRMIAGEYRVDSLPSQSGDQSQLSPSLVGWQQHLDDDSSAAMIFVDQDLQNWGSPSLAQQIYLTQNNWQQQNFQVAPDKNGQPRLVESLGGSGQTFTGATQPTSEAWYDAGSATVGYLFANVSFDNAAQNANFAARLAMFGGDVETAAGGASINLYTQDASGNPKDWPPAGTSPYLTPDNTPRRFAVVRWRFTAAGFGPNATRNARWRLAVYGPHNCPRYTNPGDQSGPGGLLASDVIAYALSQWCPLLNFTTGGPSATIQPSSFVIPQLVFLTPGTVSPMIQAATAFELLDWAVWERQTFYLAPRGQSSKTRFWRVRSGPAKLQQAGPSLARLWNGVIVTYTDAAGTTRAVGPPGSGMNQTDSSLADSDPTNPLNQLGVNKWATISMTGTGTASSAIQVGAAYLAEIRLIDRSGSATLTGYVEDRNGVLWPAWMVKGGDYMSFTDAADTGYRRIVHAEYDDQTKINSVQLDAPPDALEALLQRLSVVLAPLGLS